ncbi:MAG TPA: tetratricopeptide repeat protein [Candidatus Limnocylindrales bacterium]|nr:tetratricopeptide repeat protein [Candidatus Limnocylindrales bacterium]
MGALPKPQMAEGSLSGFFDALHDLHHRAGWPSLRVMAKEVGCSHTTISAAFSAPAVPRWGLVELIVETLGGDTERFHELWLAASAPDRPEPVQPLVSQSMGAPPRQLPGDVKAFTGRTGQLADLDRLLDEAASEPTAVVISAVTGMAGVGKTALAVHWAHRAARSFPDGQLYLNLRGYDPDRPMQPAEALEALLTTLGLNHSLVPLGVADRAARLRTLLADRKMLVLLDNAHSAEQVRDLLPGTPSCFVMVTSRDTLPALVARHGAVRINVDVLAADDSVALLRRLLGARVDAEPEHALQLARRCAHLPLALRIAAELAAVRPAVPLSELVAELSNESRRLDLLAAGEDSHTAVRAVFSWSCRHLSPEALAAFRLLGLHPGQDMDIIAAAALLDVDVPAAQRVLGQLARVHLVTELRAGRYGMHDLLRAYASENAAGLEDARPARRRLFDHYVTTAGASTVDSGWLERERGNLIAVATAAVDGSPGHTVALSRILDQHLELSGRYRDGLALHGLAILAARRQGDRAAEAAARNRIANAHMRMGSYAPAVDEFGRALAVFRELKCDAAGEAIARHGLGSVAWRQGRYAEAREHLEAALSIRHELGDTRGEGAALYALGTVHRQQGNYRDALHHQRLALDIYRDCGDLVGQSRVMNNLGTTLARMGRHREAFAHYERALELNRRTGNRVGEAVALTNLGFSACRLGRYDDAIGRHEQALPLYREAGYRAGEADALHGVGDVYRRTGQLERARHQLAAAVALAHEIGEVEVESGALIDLGETLRSAGLHPEAADAYGSALALTQQTGDRYEQARALCGLAHLNVLAGEPDLARERWSSALALFEALDVPEAEEVRHLMDGPGQLRQESSSAPIHRSQ